MMEIWSVLLPVIVGGLIATVGGLTSSLIAHHLSEAASKSRRKRERFEEKFQSVYAHRDWVSQLMRARVFENGAESASPLPKALVIASLEFPDLVPSLREVDMKAGAFLIWSSDAAMRRLRGETSKINDGLNDAYRPYLDAISELEEKLRIRAEKDFV